MKRKLYLDIKGLREYYKDFVAELVTKGLKDYEIDRRVAEHYTNVCIKKYSKQQQDAMWNEVYNLIMNVPGGYWQIVQNMDYMPEFEHYRFKCLRSYWGTKGPKKMPRPSRKKIYKETETLEK